MKRFLSLMLCIAMLFGLCACAGGPFSPKAPEESEAAAETPSLPEAEDTAQTPESTAEPADKEADEDQTPEGMIYLYGEIHYDPYCIEQEIEAWGKLYEKGARHLFVEDTNAHIDYITCDSETADLIYSFVKAKSADLYPEFKYLLIDYFYLAIKEHYPETVFHGIDVQHDYDYFGPRYLEYLESIGEKDSEEYARELLACEQGRTFHHDNDDRRDVDWPYRETCMVENFIRDLEKLGTQDVMGIFGSAHVALGKMSLSGPTAGSEVFNLATQLHERYGDRVVSTILAPKSNSSDRLAPIGPLTVNGKAYETEFIAERDYSMWSTPYKHVVYWRLIDSYDDFKNCNGNGELDPLLVICASDYFLFFGLYLAECTKIDDSVEYIYFFNGPAVRYNASRPIISFEEG